MSSGCGERFYAAPPFHDAWLGRKEANAASGRELRWSIRCLMLQTRVPERSNSRWLSQWQAEVRLDRRLTSRR